MTPIKKSITAGLILLAAVAVTFLLIRNTAESPGERRTVLRMSAPSDGLLAPPLLRMIQSGALKENGIDLEFIPWRSQEQLRAFVLNNRADIIGIHLAGAANFYNRGLPVRFLGASLGNVLFVISADDTIRSFQDLSGRRLVIPLKGEYPDIFFQAVRRHFQQYEPDIDIRIQYAMSSRDAANMVLLRRADAALIAEPHASILLARNPNDFYRSLDLQDSWNEIHGESRFLPVAGIMALGGLASNETLLSLFWDAYVEAMEWCVLNPEAAARLLDELTHDPAALQGTIHAFQSCARIPAASNQERPQIESYLRSLHEAEPELFTGVPADDNFFWDAPPRRTP